MINRRNHNLSDKNIYYSALANSMISLKEKSLNNGERQEIINKFFRKIRSKKII